MQEICVRPLIWEDPTCCQAAVPGSHEYWAGSHASWAQGPRVPTPAQPRAVLPTGEAATVRSPTTRENIFAARKTQQCQKQMLFFKKEHRLLQKEMATQSSVLAWRILWTEEPGGFLSMGSHRVRHNWSDLALESERQEFESWLTLTLLIFFEPHFPHQ